METDRLRYFCAIADTGSLTKAAELLGISHSGLSKAMSVLQDDLGFKVLSPKGRGLELTDQGRALYGQSRKIIEMVNSLRAQTALTEGLRIGLPEVLALAVSESVTRELKDGVTIEDLDYGTIEARVLDRQLDFAFTFVPFPHKELDHLKIATVALASYHRAGNFAGEDPEKIPYVVPSHELKDNPLSIKIRDGWNSNLLRVARYRANSLSIALKMVQSGTCAIYVPSFLARYLNESAPKDRLLIEVDMPVSRRNKERGERSIFLVKRQSDDESKPMKTVVKLMRQICKDKLM